MKNPKSILITGASSGIGEALAKAYAKPGIILSLTGRTEERLRKVAEQCRELGATVEISVIDVRDTARLRSWIEERDADVPLDLVIANAGISNAGEEKGEQFDKDIFTVNLFGILNTVYPAISVMQKRKHGQIALMSSMAGIIHGLPRAPAYCASKAAVKSFGEGMRGKLRDVGIEVSVICPGFVKTPLTDVNKYPMPFLISVEKASKIIVKGLARNKGLIAFPLRMYFLMWLLHLLPHKLAERIVAWV
jgi:short-subunit dehydrogenase